MDVQIYGISKDYPNNFFENVNLKILKKKFDLSDYNKTKKLILNYKA